MYAVILDVAVPDPDAALPQLRENVVPNVAKAPGFVAGYWMEPVSGTGHSVVIFESEEAAKNAAERARSNMPAQVTLESVEVREVVAHA